MNKTPETDTVDEHKETIREMNRYRTELEEHFLFARSAGSRQDARREKDRQTSPGFARRLLERLLGTR